MWCRLMVLCCVVILTSCASTSSIQLPDYLKHSIFKGQEVLHIEAINLSEDGSVLSTKDDEVIIFFYSMIDGRPIELLFSKSQTFTKESPFFHVAINCVEENGTYLLVLLEQDSDQSIEQYDEMIRQHLSQMKKDHIQKDYQSIEQYLGDDDIIAIQEIPNKSDQSYEHHGSHRGDQYHYRSIFKAKR